MIRGSFNLDGTVKRERSMPCKSCGAMVDCDECYEHTREWSPFIIMHCFFCNMPNTVFDGGLAPMVCAFCGADEAEFCTKSSHERPA